MERNNFQITNKAMEYVAAVAKYQSLTKAAEELYITQPSLSRFIHNLEDNIGCKLFNRIGNRFLPTYVGERFVEYAQQINIVESQLCSELYNMVQEDAGSLRLALPVLRSAYILPAILPAYISKCPKVSVRLFEVHADFLEDLLISGKADFAILNTAAKNPNLVTHVISHDQILLVVPADHPMANAGTYQEDNLYPVIDIRKFKNDEFILQYPDQRTRQVADLILQEAGIEPRIMLTTRNIEAALKMVSLGCGICFAAETHLRHIVLPKQPVCFSLGNPLARVDLALAYLENSYRPKHFQDFIDLVEENL